MRLYVRKTKVFRLCAVKTAAVLVGLLEGLLKATMLMIVFNGRLNSICGNTVELITFNAKLAKAWQFDGCLRYLRL